MPARWSFRNSAGPNARQMLRPRRPSLPANGLTSRWSGSPASPNKNRRKTPRHRQLHHSRGFRRISRSRRSPGSKLISRSTGILSRRGMTVFRPASRTSQCSLSRRRSRPLTSWSARRQPIPAASPSRRILRESRSCRTTRMGPPSRWDMPPQSVHHSILWKRSCLRFRNESPPPTTD